MNQEELCAFARSLLGFTTDNSTFEETTAPPVKILVASDDTYGPPTVNWLWEGFIQRGKVTSIEGRGSSGKTRLWLAIAACLSRGLFPFGRTGVDGNILVEPGHSLLIQSEDDPEENAQTYRELGGAPGFLHVYDVRSHGDLQLDDAGVDRIVQIIQDNDIVLVGIDPVLQYAPADCSSVIDPARVTRLLARINRIASQTKAAVIIFRHFSQGNIGKDLSQLAQGTEAWRNGVRGQWVMLSHPDSSSERQWMQSIVVSGRNTQRVMYERYFGMEIDKGRQFLIEPSSIDLDAYCEKYNALADWFGRSQPAKGNGRGPQTNKSEECVTLLEQTIQSASGEHTVESLRDIAERNGFTKSTFYRALKVVDGRPSVFKNETGRYLYDQFSDSDDDGGYYWTR